MSRRWGRDHGGHSLGDVLGRTAPFRRARVPLGLVEAWEHALGPAARRHTRLGVLRGKVLIVHTGEPAWTVQVETMQEEICGRLREAGFDIGRLDVQGPRGKLR